MCPIEQAVRFDPQQAREQPCPNCGGSVYAPGWHCPKCEEDKP